MDTNSKFCGLNKYGTGLNISLFGKKINNFDNFIEKYWSQLFSSAYNLYHHFMDKPTHKSIFVQTRVVGGVVATKNDFPWLVSLNKPQYGRYVHYCGGAIIHDYYILTAAHCSDK